MMLLLYEDDLLLKKEDTLKLDSKKKLATKFKKKGPGMMHYFLCLEVWQKQNEISLSQGKYVVEFLKRFRIMDCKSMTMPMLTNL